MEGSVGGYQFFPLIGSFDWPICWGWRHGRKWAKCSKVRCSWLGVIREYKIGNLGRGELNFGRWELVTPRAEEFEEWGCVRWPIREGRTVKEEAIYILKQLWGKRGKAGQDYGECLAEEVGLSLYPWARITQVNCWDCWISGSVQVKAKRPWEWLSGDIEKKESLRYGEDSIRVGKPQAVERQ